MSDWSFIIVAFGLTWATLAVYTFYALRRLRSAQREYEQVAVAAEEQS